MQYFIDFSPILNNAILYWFFRKEKHKLLHKTMDIDHSWGGAGQRIYDLSITKIRKQVRWNKNGKYRLPWQVNHNRQVHVQWKASQHKYETPVGPWASMHVCDGGGGGCRACLVVVGECYLSRKNIYAYKNKTKVVGGFNKVCTCANGLIERKSAKKCFLFCFSTHCWYKNADWIFGWKSIYTSTLTYDLVRFLDWWVL